MVNKVKKMCSEILWMPVGGIRVSVFFMIIGFVVLAGSQASYGMHIADGILPLPWAGFWYIVTIPFWIRGIYVLRKRSRENPMFKPMVGLVGAAVFVFSCMPIPVPTVGTCSHPVGTGLAAILIGPSLTVVISGIALLFQALFLAHGGLTTLGADVFSMGIAGAFVGYGVYKAVLRMGGSVFVAALMGGMLADWATYAATSLILSFGLSGEGSFLTMFTTILVAFMPTQIPLGIIEGFVSATALKFVTNRRPELVGVVAPGGAQ